MQLWTVLFIVYSFLSNVYPSHKLCTIKISMLSKLSETRNLIFKFVSVMSCINLNVGWFFMCTNLGKNLSSLINFKHAFLKFTTLIPKLQHLGRQPFFCHHPLNGFPVISPPKENYSKLYLISLYRCNVKSGSPHVYQRSFCCVLLLCLVTSTFLMSRRE